MRKRVKGTLRVTFTDKDGEAGNLSMVEVEMVLIWHEAKSMDRPETDAHWFEILVPNEKPIIT